jgi:4-hydroxy-tetrahydrodipicolinate reductase
MASKNRTIGICIAGATGNVGRCLVPAVQAAEDLELVSAVSRSAAGSDLGEALGGRPMGMQVEATVDAALVAGVDVLIDYTHPTAICDHINTAIERGISVVVGTSGLQPEDYSVIEAAAKAKKVGIVTGNFSIAAALMQHLALLAAPHMPQWEVIEYNHASKPDAPSGTGTELAELLSAVHRPENTVPESAMIGRSEARGAKIDDTHVHSVRLQGYASACEVIFGMTNQRLTIRHDVEPGGTPFVFGSLFAARAVLARPGLTRGLDSLLFRSS